MHDVIVNLFSSGSFIPHGHCYLWKPGLVWLHFISDAIIALAYYSIPLTLFYFVRKRQDLPFSWIFLLFAAFIISCGTTHIAAIWTLWHPTYWLSGIIKAGTAIVSLFTAIELVPLVPQALALPSPIQLSNANEALHAQIEERLQVENELRRLQDELDQRVQARTAELVNVNQQLQQEIDERHRAEAALRASRERLVLAQQVGKIGTCEWNVQTGELIWTEEMEALFGLEPGSFEGSYEYWLKRLHPDDRSVADLAARLATTEGADFDTEVRIILPDGKIRWVAARAKIFYDDAGKPDRLIGVNMDITERKQAQQELQQTLQTLRTLIQASPLPIVVIEPDMTVKLWSAAAEQLFGWSEAELLGQRLPVVPEEKQEECRQLREAVTNGEIFFAVETYRRKRDGSNVVLSISAAPIYDDGGSVNAILLILQDITEQQQAQAALRDSEERLRLALIAANQGLYDLNVQTGDAIVTPEYARMLGYEPENFSETNAKWRDRLHPDDVAVVYQAYEDYVAGRRDEYRVEFRQRTQSGDWKWILSLGKIVSWDNQGQPIRMLGTHTDISDRKQAELEIRKFVSLTDNSTEFIGMCDMDFVPFYVNAAGRQMVGLDDVRQYNETPVREFFFPEDQDFIVNEFFPDVLCQGRAEVEIRFRHFKTGEALWMIYNVFYVRGENDQPIGLATVSRNITDRKQAEAERERLLVREQAAREQAEAANRIKDEFLAVLSHELRSPLNPILGWAKLLRTRKLDEQKTAHALLTIERNASLQTQLIGDLLDVSRILQGKLSLNIAPVDLATTIAAAMETVRLAAQAKSIQIHTALNEAIGQVSGDCARLQQIIWNLLSNAVKFTPEGGQVEVRLERVGTYAQITVSDTGKGISPDFLPYVFDYFRQADGATTRKFGGLGLGLAIARHLTELHGGTVTVQSLGEGQGATFTVRLPLLKEAAGLDNEPSSNCSTDLLATSPLAGLQILVVDDDADTREYLSFVLEQAGATVICGVSADEALQVLMQLTPDILLSDIGMPQMDGYTLMRRVRAMPCDRGGQIRAIALTAYAGEMNQQQALAAGFQRHIAKPVEPETLIQAIASLSSTCLLAQSP
jgi:PAS domain S-box-containing protein